MKRVHRLVAGLCLFAGVLLAACGSSVSTAPPSPSTRPPASAASAAPSTIASGSVSSSPVSAAGQTDTAWGRIWDTLPTGFPPIAGATPGDAANGPASASLVVQGNAAKSIATNMQAALEAAGFRTQGLSGQLEDGSYVLDSVGTPTGCLVQVTAAPIGGVTTVMIMYGALCPHG